MDKEELMTCEGGRRYGFTYRDFFEVSKENKELKDVIENLEKEVNKLRIIEEYLNKQPDIPLDIEINVKNIIYSAGSDI